MLNFHMVALLPLLVILTPTTTLDKTDTFIKQEMEVRRIPGVALAVIKNGKVVKKATYGFADLEHKVKVQSYSVFELASLTKQFTATAIMLLAEDGKLSVDDPLNKYLTDAPEEWKQVTLRHLLNHTGGFATLRDGFKDLPRTTNRTTQAMYENLKSRGLQFVPGDKFSYSDEGYFLLGMVVEKASGYKYSDFLKMRIFEPLGMKTASVPDLREILPHRVRGYTLYNGDLINIMRQVRTELPSHYGVFATIDDMIMWEIGLQKASLLPKKKWQEMWTDGRLNNKDTAGYGFGWNVWKRNGSTVLNHTGISGTEISRFPDEGITVIILTNLGTWGIKETAAADPYGMTQPIAGMFSANLEFKSLKEINPQQTAVAKQVLQSLVKGEIPQDGVTEQFKVWAQSQYYYQQSYGFLGKLIKLELVEAEDGGQTNSYKATFEKGTRYVAFEFQNELIDSVFPVDA